MKAFLLSHGLHEIASIPTFFCALQAWIYKWKIFFSSVHFLLCPRFFWLGVIKGCNQLLDLRSNTSAVITVFIGSMKTAPIFDSVLSCTSIKKKSYCGINEGLLSPICNFNDFLSWLQMVSHDLEFNFLKLLSLWATRLRLHIHQVIVSRCVFLSRFHL